MPDCDGTLLRCIVERVNVGIFAVDAELNLVLWNGFMESHSGLSAEAVIGRNLFGRMPPASLSNNCRYTPVPGSLPAHRVAHHRHRHRRRHPHLRGRSPVQDPVRRHRHHLRRSV